MADMLADGHRNAAENIEATIALLGASPRAARLIIEGAWGAGFHWIALGCETKRGKHQESHARLGTFLWSLGETTVADAWEQLDRIRQGGWYGSEPDTTKVAGTVVNQTRPKWPMRSPSLEIFTHGRQRNF